MRLSKSIRTALWLLLVQGNLVFSSHAAGPSESSVGQVSGMRTDTQPDSAGAARVRHLLTELGNGSELRVKTQTKTLTGELIRFDGESLLLGTDILEETEVPYQKVEELYKRVPVDKRKSGLMWGILIGSVVGVASLGLLATSVYVEEPVNVSGAVLGGVAVGGTLGGMIGTFAGASAHEWVLAYTPAP